DVDQIRAAAEFKCKTEFEGRVEFAQRVLPSTLGQRAPRQRQCGQSLKKIGRNFNPEIMQLRKADDDVFRDTAILVQNGGNTGDLDTLNARRRTRLLEILD